MQMNKKVYFSVCYVFLSILLGTLVACLLANLSTTKATIREDESAVREGEGTIRANQNF